MQLLYILSNKQYFYYFTDSSSGIGDNLVLSALEDAKKTVDKAVNSTIEAFFSKKAPQSPSFLMRVLRSGRIFLLKEYLL